MTLDTPAKIAILGAGPIGVEAALYARFLGYDVDLIERGRIAENVLQWGHVQLFSPFGMNRSPLGLQALAAQDQNYVPPGDDEMLSGREYAQRYLIPLANTDLLAGNAITQTTVLSVGRSQSGKAQLIGDQRRGLEPFRLLVRNRSGEESLRTADAVIDTTGVFGNANHLGRGGMPAAGEAACRSHIDSGLPSFFAGGRERFAGRHTLIVGAGYTAATNVVALARLAEESFATRVTWLTRPRPTPASEEPVPRIPGDRLPDRDRLAEMANQLAADPDSPVTHVVSPGVEKVVYRSESDDFLVTLAAEAESEESPQQSVQLIVDRILANVGYRPDAMIYGELQVHQCYGTDGPMKLAAALLAKSQERSGPVDCLDQVSCGPESLVTSEPHFYILGSKSYGRNSSFLISVGLEQIRDLFKIIVGRESLDLYATYQPASS